MGALLVLQKCSLCLWGMDFIIAFHVHNHTNVVLGIQSGVNRPSRNSLLRTRSRRHRPHHQAQCKMLNVFPPSDQLCWLNGTPWTSLSASPPAWSSHGYLPAAAPMYPGALVLCSVAVAFWTADSTGITFSSTAATVCIHAKPSLPRCCWSGRHLLSLRFHRTLMSGPPGHSVGEGVSQSFRPASSSHAQHQAPHSLHELCVGSAS